MIYSTATVPVNPDGEAPLTRTQAWAGLVLALRSGRHQEGCCAIRAYRTG